MSVLDHLIAAPGVYWGEGHGPGGGAFVARVALVVEDDHSLVFDYEAWSAQGGLHHAESARMARTGAAVVLAATSNGGDDTMVFREGDPGVFGSIGAQKVGLVIDVAEQQISFSWWWTGRDGVLREQSRATLAPMRQIVPPPAVPAPDDSPAEAAPEPDDPVADPSAPEPSEDDGPGDDCPRGRLPRRRLPPSTTRASSRPPSVSRQTRQTRQPRQPRRRREPADRATEGSEPSATVPWPGILVLHGPSTGLVAQRLAARLTRAAVVRTDLFDRAVRGTAGRPDPALRQRIALSVVQGYAATGHPVILHGASSRAEHEALAAAISRSGLSPVKLVEVADGEDYGEVARRLIEND